MDLQEVGWRGKNWIDLRQDRDRWRALVNAIITFGLHKMRRISWPAENLLDSQEGLCSMELVIIVPFMNVTEFSLFKFEWPSCSVQGRLLILEIFKQHRKYFGRILRITLRRCKSVSLLRVKRYDCLYLKDRALRFVRILSLHLSENND
jgi:hypothetical protein